jgi:hypothetical protein
VKKICKKVLRSNLCRRMLRFMAVVLTYRGRAVTQDDVAFIRALIAAHPTASRRRLSEILCRAWNWVQPNGTLRDMVCRGLMLALHRGGQIELPARRWRPCNPLAQRNRPELIVLDESPIRSTLSALPPITFRQVRRTKEEATFNGLIEAHHYLGYTQPVGEHLKYLISSSDRLLACLAWSSAPRHLGPRDRFIGWSPDARRRNLRLLAYNLRFLILPWVQVPHLASHLLGRMACQLPHDWERVYGHPVVFLETFVDPTRFAGTCYRAANWIVLGRTTGRGKNDQTGRANRPLKEILGYPLSRWFRAILCG